jgi:uncharacterized protein YdhG (YjbR/CyaY superfamily)
MKVRVTLRSELGYIHVGLELGYDQSYGTIKVRVRSGLGYDQVKGTIRVKIRSELG